MEMRPLLPEEQKYTYAASTQLEGQTGSVEILLTQAMAFTRLGLIPERSGKRKNLRQNWTRLSMNCGKIRDFCITVMI